MERLKIPQEDNDREFLDDSNNIDEDNSQKEKEKKKKRRKIIQNIILWIINIVIVALVVRWILKQDITNFKDIFNNWKVIVYIIGFLVLMLFKAFRYCLLQIDKLSFGKSFIGLSLGFFLNSLIPARVGDISRVIYLSSEQKEEIENDDNLNTKATAGDYIGSLVFEKLFDLFSLLILTGIIILVTSIYVFEDIWPIFVVAISFIVLLVIAILLTIKYHRFFDKIIIWFVSKFNKDLKQEINLTEQVGLYTKSLFKKPWKIILNVFLSMMIVLADTTLIYLLLSTIIVDLPYHLGILAGSVGLLSVIFPLLPGGLGTYEGSMVLTLAFFEYASEVVLAVSFSEHLLRTLIYYIIGLPIYIIILITRRVRKQKQIRENQEQN